MTCIGYRLVVLNFLEGPPWTTIETRNVIGALPSHQAYAPALRVLNAIINEFTIDVVPIYCALAVALVFCVNLIALT